MCVCPVDIYNTRNYLFTLRIIAIIIIYVGIKIADGDAKSYC